MPNTRSLASDHRRHDRLLVARFAVGDAQFGQDHEAQDLVRRCTECAALAADIGHISRAVGQLPAPPRPRDFRLSAEQADRLRGSRVERWLRTLSGTGWATLRPVAAVALSVGLVMSVVGVLPIVGAAAPGPGAPENAIATDRNLGSEVASQAPIVNGGSTPDPMQSGAAAVTGPDVPGRMNGSPQPPLEDFNNIYVQQSRAPEPVPGQSTVHDKAAAPAGLGLRDVLAYAGLGLVALALAVLVLLYAARQRFSDPLLR